MLNPNKKEHEVIIETWLDREDDSEYEIKPFAHPS
jgi:hypothetical protein